MSEVTEWVIIIMLLTSLGLAALATGAMITFAFYFYRVVTKKQEARRRPCV